MEKTAKHFTEKYAFGNDTKKNHLMSSSWNLGKTATIRIPVVLKEELQGIARHIDNGGKVSLDNSKTVLSQDTIAKNNLEIPFTEAPNNAETILSQDTVTNVINILRHGITSKKQGGVYDSSNASSLKKEVVKALAILEELVTDE